VKSPEVVNIHQAKTHLSRLLVRVGRGEEIIIAKAGKPVARLAPVPEKPKRRVPGLDKGKIWMAPDFEAPLPDEILDEFYK
jgi:prevent-host-death family protein